MGMLITLIRVRTQANTADAQHKIDYWLLITLYFSIFQKCKYADELWLAEQVR